MLVPVQPLDVFFVMLIERKIGGLRSIINYPPRGYKFDGELRVQAMTAMCSSMMISAKNFIDL
jgi:hypothetical protein